MHVPNADKATLSLKKITHYLLRTDHTEGGPKAKALSPILRENIAAESAVCSDEAGQYVSWAMSSRLTV